MNENSSQSKINLSERFPDMRPVKKPPTLITMNGIGATVYGRRDVDLETGTYVKTHCFCFLYIPLLALGAYRVADGEGRTWYFLGKEPLSAVAKGWNYLMLCMGLVGGAGLGWNSYVSSPDYVARQELRVAKEQLRSGDALKAAGAFSKLAGGSIVSIEAREGLRLALEQCLQSDLASTNEAAFRILASSSQRPAPLIPDAFKRGLAMIEKHRDRDPETALRLFTVVSPLGPKDESLAALQIGLLKQAIALRPEDTNRIVELALIYEKADQLDESHKLLLTHRTKLGSTEGARILGRHLLQEGRHEEAYGLLYPYVQTRLTQLRGIERTYTNAAAAAYEQGLNYLRQGNAPQTFYDAYDKASKDKQEEMVDQFIQKRIKGDPTYTRALASLTEANQIVHVTLDLGIIQLNRAQGFTEPAARKKELEEAEKTFLAIRGLAGETDEYRLFLGQVYYWLGKSKEGRELFDQLLASKDRSYAVLMSLGSTLREVGEEKQAHELLEEAYRAGKSPKEKHSAASVRAATSRDVTDKIAWLEKTDISSVEAQVALNSARGEQALEQGDKETAAQFLRKAIDGYESLGRTPATLNNAGLACLSLYETTGRIEDQDRGVSLLEQAIALEPGHSVLLINISHILAMRAVADVSRNVLRLDLLKETVNHNVLPFLYDNDRERTAFYARLRANENMKKALNYLDKALLLAPKNRRLYLEELHFLSAFEDLGELQKLQQRMRNAELGTAEPERELQESLSGTKDRENLEKIGAHLKKFETMLQSTEVQQHTLTHVYVACSLNNIRQGMTALGERVDSRQLLESAQTAVQKHHCAGSSSGQIHALFHRAQEELAARNPEFAALAKRTARILSPRYLIALLLERGGVLAEEIRKNQHVQEALALQKEGRQRYTNHPSIEHWATIRVSDPTEALRIENQYKQSTFARLLNELQFELSPLSGSAVLDMYWDRKLMGDAKAADAIYERAVQQGLPLPPLARAVGQPSDAKASVETRGGKE